MLVIVLASVGVIAVAMYLGVFSPHPEIALDTFNGVYGTAGTRIDTRNTGHTTGRSINPYGTHLKSETSGMMNLSEGSLTEEQVLDVFRGVLRDVDELDSDNDGHSNVAEIMAQTYPGDPEDHPATERK